jgi:hypothetical protein
MVVVAPIFGNQEFVTAVMLVFVGLDCGLDPNAPGANAELLRARSNRQDRHSTYQQENRHRARLHHFGKRNAFTAKK